MVLVLFVFLLLLVLLVTEALANQIHDHFIKPSERYKAALETEIQCVIPFDALMSDEMATSIARIHAGCNQYGNFHSKVNTNLRRKYYYRRQKQKQKLELQNVLQVTGLPLTADNMIRLYHELSVSRCDNAGLRARLQNVQEVVATLRM